MQRVNSEFGTLGIRIPDYSLIIDIIKDFGHAITSTSANASGKKRPYKIQDVFDGLCACGLSGVWWIIQFHIPSEEIEGVPDIDKPTGL